MKIHIQKLAAISRKRTRLIIGLMSGTSLDGLDVALCSFQGSGLKTKVALLHFETLPYDEAFKAEIRRVFARQAIDFQHLVLLNVMIAERHAEIVNECLRKWNLSAAQIDLIASHGQTVFHAPKILHGLTHYPNGTLQIGDGDHLARRTGIITLSDFRQKHLAAGGEGAPLALYGDYFLFSKPGEDRFLLNIGGIANFSYLPASADASEALATDTGPGNTLLDAFAGAEFGVAYDQNAMLAQAGRVDFRLLEILMEEPFFSSPIPKTTGPELFSLHWMKKAIERLPKGGANPYDVMATLTRLSAETIAETIRKVGATKTTTGKKRIFVSGGGAHNPLIMKFLRELLADFNIEPMKKIGIDGDAKEAVLFAVLANETVAGVMNEDAAELGGVPLVGMGKISLPG